MLPEDYLRGFCRAFGARDPDAVADLFGLSGLLEFPFLKPRLVGSAEVREGFLRAFSVASACEIELIAVKATATVAIGEGKFGAISCCSWRA